MDSLKLAVLFPIERDILPWLQDGEGGESAPLGKLTEQQIEKGQARMAHFPQTLELLHTPFRA